jgi:hypothetical protein
MKRKLNRIPRKNPECHGCELYTLYGVRSCKAIKGKHFIEFKSQCPCCSCLRKVGCRCKSLNSAKELYAHLSFEFPDDILCYEFGEFRERFIGSIQGYYTDGSYHADDFYNRELHYMMKLHPAELINNYHTFLGRKGGK